MRIIIASVTRNTAFAKPTVLSIGVTCIVFTALNNQVIIIIKLVTGIFLQLTIIIISKVNGKILSRVKKKEI